MVHFQIQRHRKPLPPLRIIKYPFREMLVNDTFTFPYAKHRTVRSGASKMGQELGWLYRVEKVDADTGRCVRVK